MMDVHVSKLGLMGGGGEGCCDGGDGGGGGGSGDWSRRWQTEGEQSQCHEVL